MPCADWTSRGGIRRAARTATHSFEIEPPRARPCHRVRIKERLVRLVVESPLESSIPHPLNFVHAIHSPVIASGTAYTSCQSSIPRVYTPTTDGPKAHTPNPIGIRHRTTAGNPLRVYTHDKSHGHDAPRLHAAAPRHNVAITAARRAALRQPARVSQRDHVIQYAASADPVAQALECGLRDRSRERGRGRGAGA